MFDVKKRNKAMSDSLDEVQKMIDRSEVEGFIIIMRNEEQHYRQLIYPGRIAEVDWIGSLEVCKSTILAEIVSKIRNSRQ